MSNVYPLPGGFTEPYVTVRELAVHLAMSERWVRYRVVEGMPHIRYGRSLRFRVSVVDAWLTERYTDAA